MRSPFFSESEGYQFVLLTVAAFAAIAVASLLGGAWAGVPVCVVLIASAVLFYARRGRVGRRIKTAPAHVGAKDERRILVLALEPVGGGVLDVVQRASARGRVQLLVVCPASVSSVRHWASDVDGGRARAQQVLDESLVRLRAEGIDVRGEIGDEDPLAAIEDALRTFGADEICISTGIDGAGDAAVAGARERYALPITHLQSGAQA
jgi:hypothetical protein